jgi:hypothetical protein
MTFEMNPQNSTTNANKNSEPSPLVVSNIRVLSLETYYQ